MLLYTVAIIAVACFTASALLGTRLLFSASQRQISISMSSNDSNSYNRPSSSSSSSSNSNSNNGRPRSANNGSSSKPKPGAGDDYERNWKTGYIFVDGKKGGDNRRNPRRNDPWWMREEVPISLRIF
jgi:hypothetical protein